MLEITGWTDQQILEEYLRQERSEPFIDRCLVEYLMLHPPTFYIELEEKKGA